MIKSLDIRTDVIPVLNDLKLYNRDMEELLIATIAQETLGGTYLAQINGPAKGIYQMEPVSHDNLRTWASNQTNNPAEVAHNILMSSSSKFNLCNAQDMCGNLYYATIMARLFYLRHEIQDNVVIPMHTNLLGIWIIYKKYWNTFAGKATQEEFFTNYHNYVKY